MFITKQFPKEHYQTQVEIRQVRIESRWGAKMERTAIGFSTSTRPVLFDAVLVDTPARADGRVTLSRLKESFNVARRLVCSQKTGFGTPLHGHARPICLLEAATPFSAGYKNVPVHKTNSQYRSRLKLQNGTIDGGRFVLPGPRPIGLLISDSGSPVVVTFVEEWFQTILPVIVLQIVEFLHGQLSVCVRVQIAEHPLDFPGTR